MIVQLNLLPDVKKQYLQAQKSKALVMSCAILVTLGAVGISVLLFLYVNFGQQLQSVLLTNDIKSRTAQLNNIQDLGKYLTIQNQLKALPDLHDQKGAYSRLFTFLPLLNPGSPNNVKLSVLQLTGVDGDKSVIFTGTTANYQSLNVFVDTLHNVQVSYKQPNADQPTTVKMFSTVDVQNADLSQSGNTKTVSFTLHAVYDPTVFDVHNTDVTATVPNIVTTPSVTGAPKPQLFDQSGGH
jgi:Tfp pilus assembly protein PilN